MTQRRGVLVRENRLGQRLEQRHEALDAVGQRPRRDRQPHIGQPGRDPMQGTAADEALVEQAHPDADPVGRVVEQPRHRRRGHFPRRGGAVADPAVARPDDRVLVCLDFDFEEGGAPLAIGGIGLAATRTDARILRRIARFLLLLEPGALGPPVSGGAALLAALAPGARLLLLLALAAVERLRQDAPGRPQPVELGLQRLDARGQRRVLRRQIPNLGAQPAILLPQRRDQPRGPHDRRPEPIVALAQPRDRALPGCHQPLGRREPLVELLAQRLGHAGALAGHLHNLRAASIEVLLQPVDLVLAPRLDPLPVLVSPVQRNAKIGHLVVQEPEPALQRLRGPRPDLRCGRHRAGGILRPSNSRLEP